jgi:hypothetical protein
LKDKEYVAPEQASKSMIAVIKGLKPEKQVPLASYVKDLEANPRHFDSLSKKYQTEIAANTETQTVYDTVNSSTRSASDRNPFAEVTNINDVI